jgi:hypothetical protein
LKARPLLRIRYGGELDESGLKVFDNMGSDDIWFQFVPLRLIQMLNALDAILSACPTS